MEDTKQRSMLSFISHGNLPGANNPCRPWSSVPHASKKRQRQLCLDLGQKAFGPTPCPSCGMVYNKGEPEDEKQHRVFHQRCSNSLKFPVRAATAEQGGVLHAMTACMSDCMQSSRPRLVYGCRTHTRKRCGFVGVAEELHRIRLHTCRGDRCGTELSQQSCLVRPPGFFPCSVLLHRSWLPLPRPTQCSSFPLFIHVAVSQGWAHERIILYESLQGRFLKVVDTDPVTHVKKATEVGTFVEQSLGLAEGWLLPTFGRSSPSQEVVFMYISPQHRVIGMLVLEYIARSSTLATIEPNYTSQAILPAESDVGRNPPSTCLRGSGVLEPCGQPSWFGCSDIVSICQADMETGCMKALQADAQKTHHSSSASLSDTKDSASASPICGVRAMWVSMESRRTKLASRMLTIARQHMIHGYTVPRQRLAFAQVNDAGRAFAEAYMAGILSLHFYQ
mmetsp:Transcript_4587/g.13483  ORF Transcript_4587/g.13483 Transcript_4587/m.13483 type:complete len:449 (+) Transcript_4587:3147-4493(+)